MNKFILILLLIVSCSKEYPVRKLSSDKNKKTKISKPVIKLPVTKTIMYLSSLRVNRNRKMYRTKSYLTWNQAYPMAKIVYKYSRKYRIDWRLMLAIFRQESDFNVKAKNCGRRGLIKKSPPEINYEKDICLKINEDKLDKLIEKEGIEHHPKSVEIMKYRQLQNDCLKKIKSYKKGRTCYDVGIGQINDDTIDRYKFDVDRLETDLDYSIEAAFIVLKDFHKRYRKRERPNWWTRYNASSPDKRKEYNADVTRFYFDINKDEMIK